MKWHRIVFLSLFSAIFSLLILGIVRVWGIWRLSLYFSLIPAGFFVIFAFSLRKMNLEQHFALLKKLYDFLENDNIPSPANLQDYPREYSKSFDAASDELVDAGLILVGNFEAPEEELGCGKKAFQRTLRSSDGSIWANVKRIRSDSLYGFFIRLLWGRRALQPIVEISMFQENDEAVVILNCRQLTAASFSGLRFIFLPDKSPVELLSWAKQYKSGVEMETDTSFRHIDHKKFASLSISHGIRMSYQITSRANPKWEGMTTEQLTEAGFSQRGIEKYRKICTMSFPEDVRPRPQQ